MTYRTFIRFIFIIVTVFLFPLAAENKSIVIASTTSLEDSGLFGYILPLFTAKTGITVKVIAKGTGKALNSARQGGADVVFVHSQPQEMKFIADGFSVKRYPVMYNDYILVGPKNDPAGVKGMKNIVVAFKKIEESKALFLSRGDKSGTHDTELRLWKAAGFDRRKERGSWYKEVDLGMKATLANASELNAYTLTDRATWITFNNKRNLVIEVEGGNCLLNQYSVILVNPKKHAHVKKKLGQAFIDWLISEKGQQAIADYKYNGKQLFFPNANHPLALPARCN